MFCPCSQIKLISRYIQQKLCLMQVWFQCLINRQITQTYTNIYNFFNNLIMIILTVAHINRQVQSRVNLIKVVLNCLKFTQELELMILKIRNYRGVIDNVHNSLILSSRRKCYKEDPPKTTKNNWGRLTNIFAYI